MSVYYVAGPDRAVLGPYDLEDVRHQVAEGRVGADTLICPEGSDEWRRAADLPELGFAVSAPAMTIPPPPPVSSDASNAARASLVGPVLVTVFCCVIGGVVSIVYAAQANSAAAAGNIEAALRARRSAHVWMWLSFGIGLLVSGLYGVAMILSAVGQTP